MSQPILALIAAAPAVPLLLFAVFFQPIMPAKHRAGRPVRRILARLHVDRELKILPRYWFGDAEATPAWTVPAREVVPA